MSTFSFNHMKKFTGKLLVYVLLITIVTLTVNFVYVKRNKADPNYTNRFASIPDTIQICNFGSSHGLFGLNYEDWEDNFSCFNFGLPYQTLSYDYRLFQYYGDHIGKGAIVFIPISYASLFGVKESSLVDFPSINRRYYSILPPPLIKEYDPRTDMYVRYLPALIADRDVLVKALLGLSKDTMDEVWHEVSTNTDVRKIAERRFYTHVGDEKHYYDENGNRIENQEEIDALYALIEGCQERGAIPILITTPFLHEFTDAIKENAEDFFDHFYSLIGQVVRDTGIEYHDYAFDNRFMNEYSWFRDPDHLNKEGAREFVNILMREVVYAKGR